MTDRRVVAFTSQLVESGTHYCQSDSCFSCVNGRKVGKEIECQQWDWRWDCRDLSLLLLLLCTAPSSHSPCGHSTHRHRHRHRLRLRSRHRRRSGGEELRLTQWQQLQLDPLTRCLVSCKSGRRHTEEQLCLLPEQVRIDLPSDIRDTQSEAKY